MRRLVLALLALLPFTLPATADVVDQAFENAFATFESAYRDLGATEFGVDTAAYRDAVALQPFSSPTWGQEVRIDVQRAGSGGECSRYVAFVQLPPLNGAVPLVICPRFTNEGTLSLRTLTVLHELVHAVAGPDECRAMAFAAQIEQLATGGYTQVDRYWRENGCPSSAFRLP